MRFINHEQGYSAIEAELQKRREQYESVKGKDKPFRVEFRYRNGCKHWQYFTSYEDALKAEDTRCRYGIYGNAIIERPSSEQIQIRGKRGGWSKYNPTTGK